MRTPKIEKRGRKYRIRKWEDGKIKIYTFDTYDEALNFLHHLEKGKILKQKSMKLSEGFKIHEEYLYSRKQDALKVKKFHYSFVRFIEVWGDIEFAKITKNHIENYISITFL